ncbi:hypothetical protein B0H17DRAFT_1125021 [Mycena rosella]|uniref:Uncharacterized protein n=1 Tax=Mycena rosella TaxID=1033263 RepID=A0AAD7GYR3_MYCRO|nr:hypothetical protein B0H17DRAFT_1125021 [Mycena rosella]
MHRILGSTDMGRPSLDYLWYPPEERVVDEPTPVTSDASIVAQVRHEAAVERGEIIKIDDKDSESEDEEKSPEMTTAEVMKLCCTHKTACLSKGDLTQSMELSRALRQFRGNIQREETKNARQLTLSEAWGASLNNPPTLCIMSYPTVTSFLHGELLEKIKHKARGREQSITEWSAAMSTIRRFSTFGSLITLLNWKNSLTSTFITSSNALQQLQGIFQVDDSTRAKCEFNVVAPCAIWAWDFWVRSSISFRAYKEKLGPGFPRRRGWSGIVVRNETSDWIELRTQQRGLVHPQGTARSGTDSEAIAVSDVEWGTHHLDQVFFSHSDARRHEHVIKWRRSHKLEPRPNQEDPRRRPSVCPGLSREWGDEGKRFKLGSGRFGHARKAAEVLQKEGSAPARFRSPVIKNRKSSEGATVIDAGRRIKFRLANLKFGPSTIASRSFVAVSCSILSRKGFRLFCCFLAQEMRHLRRCNVIGIAVAARFLGDMPDLPPKQIQHPYNQTVAWEITFNTFRRVRGSESLEGCNWKIKPRKHPEAVLDLNREVKIGSPPYAGAGTVYRTQSPPTINVPVPGNRDEKIEPDRSSIRRSPTRGTNRKTPRTTRLFSTQPIQTDEPLPNIVQTGQLTDSHTATAALRSRNSSKKKSKMLVRIAWAQARRCEFQSCWNSPSPNIRYVTRSVDSETAIIAQDLDQHSAPRDSGAVVEHSNSPRDGVFHHGLKAIEGTLNCDFFSITLNEILWHASSSATGPRIICGAGLRLESLVFSVLRSRRRRGAMKTPRKESRRMKVPFGESGRISPWLVRPGPRREGSVDDHDKKASKERKEFRW